MNGKPTVPTGIVRQKIREVLNMRPGFGKTEAQLLEFVNQLVGGGVTLQQVRDAIEWNHGEAYIRLKDDREADLMLWFITSTGIAQENIK